MKKSKGFSLIEGMITALIGLFILGGVITMYMSVVKSNSDNMRRLYLTQDVRTALSLMTRDVKRAGYWPKSSDVFYSRTALKLGSASVGVTQVTDSNSTSLFSTLGTDLTNLTLVGLNGKATILNYVDANTIQANVTVAFDSTTLSAGSWAILNPFSLIFPTNETPSTCVLLTYDRDNDNTVDANEQIGYRLMNNTIQIYQSGTFACDNGVWENITDTNTQVNSLQFTLSKDSLDVDGTGSGTSQVIEQSLTIAVSASLKSDAAVTYAYNDTYRLANDVFVP